MSQPDALGTVSVDRSLVVQALAYTLALADRIGDADPSRRPVLECADRLRAALGHGEVDR